MPQFFVSSHRLKKSKNECKGGETKYAREGREIKEKMKGRGIEQKENNRVDRKGWTDGEIKDII
jgi:hypothetical protein